MAEKGLNPVNLESMEQALHRLSKKRGVKAWLTLDRTNGAVLKTNGQIAAVPACEIALERQQHWHIPLIAHACWRVLLNRRSNQHKQRIPSGARVGEHGAMPDGFIASCVAIVAARLNATKEDGAAGKEWGLRLKPEIESDSRVSARPVNPTVMRD
ncbi:hypothetical protein NUW58_g5800 [Xylaria curta]|uniref:Uncharacterized protein n=1 Tax=Xylaria curta TaxID=42375 RepID=A0ACC1P2D1_9PEZI|nr:hypothetical protein NUW58_g5800 [Xylaria curta]